MKTQLQGIWKVEAIKASDLKIGSITIWNYGYKSEVVGIEPSKTGKTITFKMKSLQDGETRERKMTANRLVGIEQEAEQKNEIEKAIKNRKETYNGIYSDIGTAIEKFSTAELAEYYINVLNCDSALRYYLEQQIIASEINKIKTA